jgi:hypothetical protein
MKYRVTLALTLNPLAGGALCPGIQPVGATNNPTFILVVAMNATSIARKHALLKAFPAGISHHAQVLAGVCAVIRIIMCEITIKNMSQNPGVFTQH